MCHDKPGSTACNPIELTGTQSVIDLNDPGQLIHILSIEMDALTMMIYA